MVYNITGQTVTPFLMSGTVTSAAYNVSGFQVYPDSFQLTVMTFNEQGWSGINNQLAMQRQIFSTYSADIIGFQEFCSNGVIPTIARNALTDYPNIQLTNHKNYNAMASKATLTDWTIADYQTQDQYDIDTWGETRTYMRGYLTMHGKRIAVFNTHLCVHNQAPRYAQAAELFALAQQEEYCIITGDFNSTEAPLGVASSDYINEFKPFVDAGYHLANNSPEAGFTNTHSSATYVPALADLTSALDSIIVSGNITIDSVVFDPTKLSYQNNQKFDHIPVIATLTVN